MLWPPLLMLALWAVPHVSAQGSALVCPPFCVGSGDNEYRALALPLVFVGRVVAAQSAARKRLTGASGETNYLVELLEVFRGGLYRKRVGKSTVHVFSGQSFELGSECGVLLAVNSTYLLGGVARRGTTARETTRIDINNCTLSKPWDAVSERARLWLRQVVQPAASKRCDELTTSCANTPLSCAACAAPGDTCVTNAFVGGWCGACTAWCVPSVYMAAATAA